MKIAVILSALFLNQLTSAATYEYGEKFANYRNCDGSLAYPFCSASDESPINIQTSNTKDGDSDSFECDEELDWVSLKNSGKKVVKKEHTIEVEADKHGYFENPVDVDPELTDFVEKFCLEQVHFHWGLNNNEGSEHTLNGRRFPLEAHFVHYNCERDSVTDVQNQYDTIAKMEAAKAAGKDTHELGVIGVWFEISENENPAIEVILDRAENIHDEHCAEKQSFTAATCPSNTICQLDNGVLKDCICKEDYSGENCQTKDSNQETEEEDVDLDLTDILSESVQEKGYWTYEGSLTTPPCTDDVRWFIMKGTAYLSQRQMDRFRAIKRPCSDQLIAPNFRPVQGNVNAVYSCGDDDDSNDSDDGDSDDSDDKETVTITRTVNGKKVKVALEVEVESESGDDKKDTSKNDTEKDSSKDDTEKDTGNVQTGTENDDTTKSIGDENEDITANVETGDDTIQ